MSPATRAALLAIAGDAVLTVMDIIVKGMTATYPTLQIAGLRFGFGTLVAAAVFVWLKPGMPSRETIRANGLRSLLVVVTSVSFVYALGKLPFAETFALAFVSPLFMVLFGALLLKEKLDARIGIALATGFVGMLLIASPHLGGTEYGSGAMWGIAAVLLSALSYSMVIIVLRVRAQVDPAITIVLFQNAGPALILAIPAAMVWQPVSGTDLLAFAGLSVLGVAGHLLLARAFAEADAARLAPLHYLSLVWAVLLGYAVYAEVPTATTLSGAALIVVGTILTHRRRSS